MAKAKEFLKLWGAQIRSNFLLLAVFLVAIGLALSALYMKRTGIGSFSVIDALLIMIGVTLTHASVNLFNEYSDHKTGIDSNTKRTPFSGGTGLLQAGKTTPQAVATAAWQTLYFAFYIGLYFTIMSHWFVMVIMVIGAISVVYYTQFFAKWLMGEFFAGLSLGSLVVIGTFVAMTGASAVGICALFPPEVILVSIPPGILTFLLLFLNEFPDVEADKGGGRFHLVILLGRKKASWLYIAGLILTYVFIILAAAAGTGLWWLLLGCGTIPLALKAGMTVLSNYDDMKKLVPAMGMNVMIVLATDALLAVGIVIELITS